MASNVRHNILYEWYGESRENEFTSQRMSDSFLDGETRVLMKRVQNVSGCRGVVTPGM